MGLTVEEALEQVEQKLDDVGMSLSPEEWIALCGRLIENTEIKKEAAEQEQEDEHP